ncbi:FG-GAP-like repeat-containing protein [Streptomyces tubercidicus]|uniref:FG-GAP-like repeat-containing protein n=1 Tax=Streptomyces tubercidicus TaxID=47759 RepID=UPI002E1008D3|nr:FG-GAP-like repeat-containing protein [Streptomyces tubercidicus]
MSKARTAQSLTALLLGGALTTAVLTAETPARTDFLAPAADAAPVTELTNVPMTATKDTAEPNTQPSKANQEINVQKNSTEPFRVIALSWKKSAPLDHDARALARFHRDGSWGRWQEIPLDGDQITDEEATRAGSPVFFSDTADGVQLRMTTPKGELPADLRLSLINPDKKAEGSAPQQTRIDPAAWSAGDADRLRPAVHSRADWGADESLADSGYKGMDSVKAMFVHHTVNGNQYSREDVPGLLRAIYTNGIRNLGYGDFPYNFVVDRFGRVWEGRKGSTDASPTSDPKAIMAGHALGFNRDTLGVATLGNFESNVAGSGPNPQPSEPMMDGLAKLLAWKGAQYGLDPKGKATLTSGGGGGNRYPKGRKVSLDVISGHRDVFNTLCPGEHLYDKLPDLRKRVAQLMDAHNPDQPAPHTPRPKPQRPAFAGMTERIASANFNGDARTDVVAIDKDGSLHVYYSKADGTLEYGRNLWRDNSWASMKHIVAGDFNGDGRGDIAATWYDGSIHLYTGNDRGALGAGRTMWHDNSWTTMRKIVPMKIDGTQRDGLLTIWGNGSIHSYPTRPDGTLNGTSSNLWHDNSWGSMKHLVTGDFNNDGRVDVAAVWENGSFHRYLGSGSGPLGKAVKLWNDSSWGDMKTVLRGDFNGDGKADLLGRWHNNLPYLYAGDGKGNLATGKRMA